MNLSFPFEVPRKCEIYLVKDVAFNAIFLGASLIVCIFKYDECLMWILIIINKKIKIILNGEDSWHFLCCEWLFIEQVSDESRRGNES